MSAPVPARTGEALAAKPRPVPSVTDWLRVNLVIGTLSFGSASRIVLYEDAVVRDHGWLSDDEFGEVLTVAQLLPGPNLVNLSAYLGYRLVGVIGAVAGILCLCLPGAALAVALSGVLALDRPWVQAPLRGMAVAGIVLLLLFLWRRLPGLGNTVDPATPASTRVSCADSASTTSGTTRRSTLSCAGRRRSRRSCCSRSWTASIAGR